MIWPTQDQLDLATNHGIEYALDEINSDINGGTGEPRESPLSGEWADDLIDRDVAFNAGWPNDAPEEELEDWQTGVSALADAWETGYRETWRSHLDA